MCPRMNLGPVDNFILSEEEMAPDSGCITIKTKRGNPLPKQTKQNVPN